MKVADSYQPFLFSRMVTFSLLFFCFVHFSTLAQNEKTILNKTLQQEAFEDAEVGVYVKNISQNKILISHRADKSMTPASILKIVTASNALLKYGPDHRYKTSVYLFGEINQGVLYGDIVIKGQGDPSFGSRINGAIAMRMLEQDVFEVLESNGVTCVYGAVIVDASYFSLPGVPAGYLQEDVANYYGAGAFGFNIQENAYQIKLDRSKKGQVSIASFDSLAIDFATTDVSQKGYSDQAYAFFHPNVDGIHIVGSIPVGKTRFNIKGALRNPPKYGARLLQKLLEDRNIEFQQAPAVVWMPYVIKKDIIFKKDYLSPKLLNLLKPILHKSNNVYAQVLHRHLLRDKTSHGDLKLQDGSGLSIENRVTANELMSTLEIIQQAEYFLPFLDVMPKNGLDGTVKSVLKQKPGTMYIKSGSIGGVRCYMGFRKSSSGDWIGFVCMANELTGSGAESRKAWETTLSWIATL